MENDLTGGPRLNPPYPPILSNMRAITLHNPWALGISHYGKRIENRGWRFPAWLDFVLIHAGAAWDQAGIRQFVEWGLDPTRATPSAIVAVARVRHRVCTAAGLGRPCGCNRWAATGQYHNHLTDVWTLTEPVPAAGKQKLWIPTPEQVDAVRADLARVTV